MTTPRPYPLRFEPILKEKVWGGMRLSQLGKKVPQNTPVGESWEIADLDATSVSGGGGGAAYSEICNGPLAGQTIRDAVRLWGSDLLGRAAPAPGGSFPLLIKYLDACDNLSVQVHPSAAYAEAHPEAHIKHEAWCVIAAAPGGLIYRGLRPDVTRDELERRIEEGSVVEALESIPARPCDIIHLPSGVVHALGAGVLVAEVQTPSDTTFRLDDWGRAGRELHIEEALHCAFHPDGSPTVPHASLPAPDERRVATDAFTIETIGGQAGTPMQIRSDGASPIILMTLCGSARLSTAGNAWPPMHLRAGDTILLPAAVSDSELLLTDTATLLRIEVPVNRS